MGFIEMNDEGIIIKAPLMWREPLWSRIHDIVASRFRWSVFSALGAIFCIVIAFSFGVQGAAYQKDSSILLLSLGSFMVLLSLAAFFLLKANIRVAVPESQLLFSEFMRYHARVPLRWRREWMKAFSGDENLFNETLFEAFRTNGLFYDHEQEIDAEWMYKRIYSYRNVARECLAMLQDVPMSYKSYPSAFLLFFLQVDMHLVRKWDAEGLDMTIALSRIIGGTKPEYIGIMVENDIDSSLMDALIQGEDAALMMASK